MTLSRDKHSGTRRTMGIAIKRLNILEYVILGLVILVTLTAGALTAWLFQGATGISFRISWIVASLLFFGIPCLLMLRKSYQAELPKKIQNSVLDTNAEEYNG